MIRPAALLAAAFSRRATHAGAACTASLPSLSLAHSLFVRPTTSTGTRRARPTDHQTSATSFNNNVRPPTISTPIHFSLSTRQMTTAYGGEPGDGKAGLSSLTWLPYQSTLPGWGRKVEVGPFLESEWQAGMDLMNLIIREGKSWPFEEEFKTIDDYRGYFLSHAAFVVRSVDPGLDCHGRMSKPGTVLGAFYIKPNYPGRCSHICNGGFISDPDYRRMGVARLMGQVFLRAARDLGYKSAYFNLVFKSNGPSVALWESLGFERVAVLESAARLEEVDGLDTAYGYRYDLETLDENYLIDD